VINVVILFGLVELVILIDIYFQKKYNEEMNFRFSHVNDPLASKWVRHFRYLSVRVKGHKRLSSDRFIRRAVPHFTLLHSTIHYSKTSSEHLLRFARANIIPRLHPNHKFVNIELFYSLIFTSIWFLLDYSFMRLLLLDTIQFKSEHDNFKNNIEISFTFYSQIRKISRIVTKNTLYNFARELARLIKRLSP